MRLNLICVPWCIGLEIFTYFLYLSSLLSKVNFQEYVEGSCTNYMYMYSVLKPKPFYTWIYRTWDKNEIVMNNYIITPYPTKTLSSPIIFSILIPRIDCSDTYDEITATNLIAWLYKFEIIMTYWEVVIDRLL